MRKILKSALLLSFSLLLTGEGRAAEVSRRESSDKAKMDRFVDRLMSRMTLHEKIGQLNLCGSGDINTGPIAQSDIAERIRKGEVGGILSLKGVKSIRALQELAVNGSRLGIPIIFAMDVIHGYETVFPIPLGLSCSWDMEGIERTARIAAVEASADGICWTYSPMVDICRDARWGRMSEGSGEDTDEARIRNYMMDKGSGAVWRPGTRQDMDEAVRIAGQSDVVVAFLGEHEMMSGESSSRSSLTVPKSQRLLLERLLQTGKPVVLVCFMGRPLVLDWETENVPAILNVWFPGSEAGDAIADVLFGDVNPSGKLTASFPRNVGQVPLHYDELPTGRPLAEGSGFAKFTSSYLDVPNTPLYPFGYGLSYTDFEYSDMTLSADRMTMDGSISRPLKQLKGFRRIHLRKGESQKVTFTITPELLKFYNSSLQYVCEPGDFEVMTGPDSQRPERRRFTLQ